METQLEFEKIPYNGDYLISSKLSPPKKDIINSLFLLHGGGIQASMERFYPLREVLLSENIETISFDFIGHGLTGGNIKSTSLLSRTEQAISVIKYYNKDNISLLGTSMGAYTAIRMTEKIPINNLILSVPAVYNTDAYNIIFGDQFSQIIRKERSWLHSQIWNICEQYTGKLLLISAKNDDVIPKEIPQQLYDKFASSDFRDKIEFDCSHQILKYINSNREELLKFSSSIINLIK